MWKAALKERKTRSLKGALRQVVSSVCTVMWAVLVQWRGSVGAVMWRSYGKRILETEGQRATHTFSLPSRVALWVASQRKWRMLCGPVELLRLDIHVKAWHLQMTAISQNQHGFLWAKHLVGETTAFPFKTFRSQAADSNLLVRTSAFCRNSILVSILRAHWIPPHFRKWT